MLQKADSYSMLDQTFHIMVCDFKVFDDDNFIHKFSYSDGDLILSDICRIIYVELPKIKDRMEKPFSEMTDDERWALLIKFADDKKFSAKAREFHAKEEFDMAIKTLVTLSKSEQEQFAYLSRLKFINDQRHNETIRRQQEEKRALRAKREYNRNLKKATQEIDKIKQEAEKAMQEGVEQGTLEAARKMLQKGMAIEDVAELTDLPAEKIREITL
jgi:predicted transposase/invertase (TIGR01784 family)